ncbi:MAG: T9SS type A sorting domain-containing protein, partial [Caldisericaceae bacterium]|nr:T9SS type A sorting domain-containing protein [Caldisericaceae bacterium]
LMVQNYPNPFNGQTTIKIKANQNGMLDWVIVDASGRLIERGQKKVIAGQPNTFNWQADHLASGVYFFRAKLQNVMKVRKLLLMR